MTAVCEQHLHNGLMKAHAFGTRCLILSTYSSPMSAGDPDCDCRMRNSLGSSGANSVSSPAQDLSLICCLPETTASARCFALSRVG